MKTRRIVTVFGLFLVLYYVCYIIYIFVDLGAFSTHRTPTLFINKKWLYMQDYLNNTKIIAPSGTMMVYNETCPFQINRASKVDVQMLEVNEKVDSGAWQQHWRSSLNTKEWNSKHKLRVFVVPHSHNDPGWLKTFEAYYNSRTRHILNTMLAKLPEDGRRKFIWAEVSFFALWWDDLEKHDREMVKTLVHNNQLEFVTGGWVMNDEGSTHWISTMYQITEGHKWLKLHLNYTPVSHWSIDPFGLSATQPMLLKQMGLKNMVIQRVHYAVKKVLGMNKYLEFRWKQFWDNSGNTEMFTQIMPYFTYGVTGSCGPNANICWNFDFRRLAEKWPWSWIYKWKKMLPEPITNANINRKAQTLLNQFRKKSALFRTNALLVPLGNDFTFTTLEEFDIQYQSYEKLFNIMNSDNNANVQVQFGTLTDYFNAVHAEQSVDNFPTLSGDFFTYADETDHYWSGYYTSRPFYKRMDRELLSHIRAAEIILTLAHLNRKITESADTQLLSFLSDARRVQALFQHHDAITGTSRKHVMADYGEKMLQAIEKAKNIIEHCTALLLWAPWADASGTDKIYYKVDDVRYSHGSLAEQRTIIITPGNTKKVVIFNSLPVSRHEIVHFVVSTPFIEVVDFKGIRINCQVSPIFEDGSRISNKYSVSFVADVPALGLITYAINALLENKVSQRTTYASVKIYNHNSDVVTPLGYPKVQVFPSAREFTIKNDRIGAAFNNFGLLKSLNIAGSTYPLDLDFAEYRSRDEPENSGAYLFLPKDSATTIRTENTKIKVIEGPLLSSITVKLPYVHHTATLFHSPGADGIGLEVQNTVDISQTSNFEIAMRLSTRINNTRDFFTDSNGYQLVRRRRFNNLPLQANYYPTSTMMYLEDDKIRLTVLTGTPLGCASLQNGQIEIMLDRRLEEDDHLGLGEGVTDNHPTKHIFKIILEKKTHKCKHRTNIHSVGFPSLRAHVASQSLLNPLIPILKTFNTDLSTLDVYSSTRIEFGVDFNLASLRNDINADYKNYIGIVLHRQYVDVCFADESLLNQFPLSHGWTNISAVLPSLKKKVRFNKASLSFLYINEEVDFYSNITLCPMDIQAYILQT